MSPQPIQRSNGSSRGAPLNREGWLTELAKTIEPLFQGFKFAPYRVTCGWPHKEAVSRKRRIGECHYPVRSLKEGGVHEIFISPLLDKALDVAGTLTHEMAHVLAGHKAGHGKGFVTVCRQVGLTKGKPTSAVPGAELTDKLASRIKRLGSYPTRPSFFLPEK